jgi:hypothetical protein
VRSRPSDHVDGMIREGLCGNASQKTRKTPKKTGKVAPSRPFPPRFSGVWRPRRLAGADAGRFCRGLGVCSGSVKGRRRSGFGRRIRAILGLADCTGRAGGRHTECACCFPGAPVGRCSRRKAAGSASGVSCQAGANPLRYSVVNAYVFSRTWRGRASAPVRRRRRTARGYLIGMG